MSLSDSLPDKTFKIVVSDPAQLGTDNLPLIMQPAGLSADRQKYPFEQIRPFRHADSRDITCSAPEVPKP